ncbi:MAG: ATP-binding protein, partial [Coriobacteriales bacterium]
MRKFKAESKKLLDMMVNSIYTNKEIFLRELISNASDSLDKLYVTSLENKDNTITRGDLKIKVAVDKDARTLTISDNGIGMTAEELEKNLGTIAHSGSLDFKNSEDKDLEKVDIIGQFGVGFYSSFMVADHVEVISKAYGADTANKWESDGVEGFTVSEAQRDERGTDVILHIREDDDDSSFDRYLNINAIRNLVKRYSDYIRYPIQGDIEKSRELPKPEDAGDDYTPQY